GGGVRAVILEVLLHLGSHGEQGRGRFLELAAPHVVRVVGDGDRRQDRDDRDRDHQFNQGETGWALHGDSLLLRLNDRELGESAANLPDEWPKSAYVRHLRRNSSGISSRFRSVTPVRVSRLAVRIRQGPNGRLKWFA